MPVPEGAFDPFFSPDGRWVGFFAGQKIKKVPVTGGELLTICDIPSDSPLGASWASDDAIFFTPSRDAGLWRVPAAGGVPQVVLKDKDLEYRAPQVLPGGKAVLFTTPDPANAGRTDQQVYVQSLDTGERHAVIQGSGGYFVNDSLIFARGNSVLAVRFDLDRLETVGTPLPLVERVSLSGQGPIDTPQVSVSHVGSLAYIPVFGFPDGALTWVDRSGSEQPLAAPIRPYRQPRLAPDGRRLAIVIDPLPGSGSDDLWTYDLSRDALASVTSGGNHSFPVWTPDGGRLTFSSSRTDVQGIYWKAADGSGPEDRLLGPADRLSSDRPGLPLSWSPDGRMLAFVRLTSNNLQDIWMLPLDEREKPEKPRPFVQTRFAEGAPVFSPDGRWLAYVSNETGRNENLCTGRWRGSRTLAGVNGRWQRTRVATTRARVVLSQR